MPSGSENISRNAFRLTLAVLGFLALGLIAFLTQGSESEFLVVAGKGGVLALAVAGFYRLLHSLK